MIKLTKKLMPAALSVTLLGASVLAPLSVNADSAKVVTLGADLSDEQKAEMYNYFGADSGSVVTIEVTNADERKYLEGVATEDQIGTRTLSCAYVEPTTEGGIQVKVANLTFATSSMIASTLLTSGVENCNVVAACPIEVSGTGALTGIMMAYEEATGEQLSEEQKAAATEELVVTGDIAEEVGDEEAADIMNEVKEEVISGEATDEEAIREVIQNVSDSHDITLTDEQITNIVNVMINISAFSYDTDSFTKTLKNLAGGTSGDLSDKGFLQGVIDTFTNVVNGATGGSSSSDAGILSETNDELLGDDATVNSTVEGLVDSATSEGGNIFDKILGFVKEKVTTIMSSVGGDSEEFSESASDNADSSTADSSTTWDFDGSEDESVADEATEDEATDDTADDGAEEEATEDDTTEEATE